MGSILLTAAWQSCFVQQGQARDWQGFFTAKHAEIHLPLTEEVLVCKVMQVCLEVGKCKGRMEREMGP